MALFDIFKKTKKEPQKKEGKELEEIRVEKVKEKKEIPRSIRQVEKKQFSEAWRILASPHVTEKSTMLSEQGVYVFKVYPNANKHEIKTAVQDLYGVKVEGVATIKISAKQRRLGPSQRGFKPGYRKAIVKLAGGEKIEAIPR